MSTMHSSLLHLLCKEQIQRWAYGQMVQRIKHGVFTYYLLEGLRGKADLDGDRVITVDELYRYVSMKVPKATGQNQHPVKKGETTGQIVLGVVK